MFIVKYRKIFYTISTFLVGMSIFAISFYGFDWSIDFTGGALTEVSYPGGKVNLPKLREEIKKMDIGNFTLQKAGPDSIILRTKNLTEKERQELMKTLSNNGSAQIQQKRFNSIGPVVGNELKSKAWVALLFVIFAIIAFVAFAFRQVSGIGVGGVSSWKYGVIAILALIHDIIIPTGVFVYLGNIYLNYQIDILFVTALLAILGFSVNDTIVVFDRIRENLKLNSGTERFDELVGKSINQTFTRSFNTSFTTLLVLLSLYFIGGETTKQFSLVLSIGVVVGTYSSIFIASPLLVTLRKWQEKRKKKK